jgi:hypothetical protein
MGGGCGGEGVGVGGVLTCLLVIMFEPVGSVSHVAGFCVAGLRVMFRLIHELLMLAYLISLTFEPFQLVSVLLVLVYPLPIRVYSLCDLMLGFLMSIPICFPL